MNWGLCSAGENWLLGVPSGGPLMPMRGHASFPYQRSCRRVLPAVHVADTSYFVAGVPQADNCAACGRQPTITAASLPSYDYAGFVGAPPDDLAPAPLSLLPPEQRIGAAQVSIHTEMWYYQS